MRRRFWAPDDPTLIELYGAGLAIKEIAARIGRSRYSTARRIAELQALELLAYRQRHGVQRQELLRARATREEYTAIKQAALRRHLGLATYIRLTMLAAAEEDRHRVREEEGRTGRAG